MPLHTGAEVGGEALRVSHALVAKSSLFSSLPCCGRIAEVPFLLAGSSQPLGTCIGEHLPQPSQYPTPQPRPRTGQAGGNLKAASTVQLLNLK